MQSGYIMDNQITSLSLASTKNTPPWAARLYNDETIGSQLPYWSGGAKDDYVQVDVTHVHIMTTYEELHVHGHSPAQHTSSVVKRRV